MRPRYRSCSSSASHSRVSHEDRRLAYLMSCESYVSGSCFSDSGKDGDLEDERQDVVLTRHERSFRVIKISASEDKDDEKQRKGIEDVIMISCSHVFPYVISNEGRDLSRGQRE